MTAHTLWAVKDQELLKLLDDARAELISLITRYHVLLPIFTQANATIAFAHGNNEERAKASQRRNAAAAEIERLEQRISGQRTFVRAVENEVNARDLMPMPRHIQKHYEEKHRRS